MERNFQLSNRLLMSDYSLQILGAANSGKSELFNKLLNSDLCSRLSLRRNLPATVSNWPGTTVGSLKFPIRKINSRLLYNRMHRLYKHRKIEQIANEYNARLGYGCINAQDARTIKGSVAPTVDSEIIFPDSGQYTYRAGNIKSNLSFTDIESARMHCMYKRSIENENKLPISETKWCIDTPGYIDSSILKLSQSLSPSEMGMLRMDSLIEPIIFKMDKGDSLLIGGLFRIDIKHIVSSNPILYLHVFSSNYLPVVHCKTVDASEIYNERLNACKHIVPQTSTISPLIQKSIQLHSKESSKSLGDLVLHGYAWIAVYNTNRECTIDMDVFVPMEDMLFVRDIPLLCHLSPINRIGKTPFYSNAAFKPHNIPIPKRQVAQCKKYLRENDWDV
ncbi:hypothetical protein GJ496_004385 [Pomphorhynchus laevis]|nr:hypothetical protein GJ496_004385 [Pomphorhynchus laevis]